MPWRRGDATSPVGVFTCQCSHSHRCPSSPVPFQANAGNGCKEKSIPGQRSICYERGEVYRCYQSVFSERAVDTSMELDAAHHRELQSNGGRVIHYQSTTKMTGTVPRTEVVAALHSAMSGGNVFEVVSSGGDKLFFQDATRNDMVVAAQSGDLTEAFAVSGAFVMDTPEIKQEVSCPAEGADTCQVTVLNDNGLVDCSSKESNVSILKENVPAKCMDEAYDMSLVVVPTPHFFLLGVKQDAEENKGCPPSIMLNSFSGRKTMAVPFTADMAHLPMQAMGTALLGDIIEAEENAVAIDDTAFDVSANNCVHYAGSIWRSLGLTEDELPSFLIEHIVDDGNIAQVVKARGGAGALVALNVGGRRALKKYVTDVVQAEFLL